MIKQMQSILRVFYGFRPGQSRALEAKAKEAEQVMRNAHIEAHLTDDIAQSHLQKFSFVSPMGATGAITFTLVAQALPVKPSRSLVRYVIPLRGSLLRCRPSVKLWG